MTDPTNNTPAYAPYCGLTPLDIDDMPQEVADRYARDGDVFAVPASGWFLAYWKRALGDGVPWQAFSTLLGPSMWSATPEAALENAGLDPALLDQMRRPVPPEGWRPGYNCPAPPDFPNSSDVRRIVERLNDAVGDELEHYTANATLDLLHEARYYIEALSGRIAEPPATTPPPAAPSIRAIGPGWIEATTLPARESDTSGKIALPVCRIIPIEWRNTPVVIDGDNEWKLEGSYAELRAAIVDAINWRGGGSARLHHTTPQLKETANR